MVRTNWILRTIAGSFEQADCIAKSPPDDKPEISPLFTSPIPARNHKEINLPHSYQNLESKDQLKKSLNIATKKNRQIFHACFPLRRNTVGKSHCVRD